MKNNNKGFDGEVLNDYKQKIQSAGRNYILQDTEDITEEYAQFYFVGKFEGSEVVYDAVLYSLRLKYESELHALAEEKLVQHFPNYKGAMDGNQDTNQDEEMGLMMAELMMEIEEEGQLQVKEEVDIDGEFDFGIGVEACLNVEEVTPDVIERFITEFNSDNLKLDPVLYSFEHNDEE